MENNDINLNNEDPSGKYYINKELWHPEKARMILANNVLIAIFIIFILAIITSWLAKSGYIGESISYSIFELCRTGLLPIVTLILGYYFSKNN